MKTFLLRLWRWIKSGWGAVSVVGGILQLLELWPHAWHVISNLDTLHSLTNEAGIGLPLLLRLAGNPFFGLGLIVVGLVGLPRLVQSESGKKISRAWPVLGWGMFICAAVMVLSANQISSFLTDSNVLTPGRIYDARVASQGIGRPVTDGLRSVHEGPTLTVAQYLAATRGATTVQSAIKARQLGQKLVSSTGRVLNIYSNVGYTIVMNGDANGNSAFCAFPLDASGPLLNVKTGDVLSMTGIAISRPSDTGITLQNCVINTP